MLYLTHLCCMDYFILQYKNKVWAEAIVACLEFYFISE